MNVWKCELIFPTDTLQQKIEITALNPFLAGENTSVLIILATTVWRFAALETFCIIINTELFLFDLIFFAV